MSHTIRKVLAWAKVAPALPGIIIDAKKCKHRNFEENFYALKKTSKTVLSRTNTELFVENAEKVNGDHTCLYIGNHQGSLDCFVVIAAMPYPLTAVGKENINDMPLFGDYFKGVEAIGFDRESPRDSVRMIKSVTESLKNGRNIVIYPEGTRSNSNTMLPFKPGSFTPAYRAKVAIQPYISVDAHHAIDVPPHKNITIRFLDEIPYEFFKDMKTPELCDYVSNLLNEEIKKVTNED
ncbi:MAG: lysophospholipid acyltransferase family protein [Erysipelotrichaceae bacterium]